MEEINEVPVEQYADIYENEGYHLSTSASIFVPWFQCTLRCKCMTDQPMSGFDGIVCKCIKRGINRVNDISFILALDTEVVSGEIEELVLAGVIVEENEYLELTEAGEISYQNNVRAESEVKEFNVFMNAITGKWVIDANSLISEVLVPDKSIKLQPLQTVIKMDVENNDEIRKELQERNNTNILSIALLEYKVALYSEEKILFYKNDNKIMFSILDCEKKELDTVLADALLKKYERRELLEIMQAEESIREAEKKFISEDKLLSGYKTDSNKHNYYRNKEIRELFKNIFDLAQKSVFIISPWIDNNNYVMTDEVLDRIESALSERKIEVSIGYGYTSPEKMEMKRKKYSQYPDNFQMERDKDWQTELMANKLKDRFKEYANFSIFYVGTHEKILSYDDRFTLVGSYNLLSYDGGEKDRYQGFHFRFEGGVMIEDPEFARYVKGEIMNRGLRSISASFSSPEVQEFSETL